MRICPHCKVGKPESEFQRLRTGRTLSWCKACRREQRAAKRREDPEAAHARDRLDRERAMARPKKTPAEKHCLNCGMTKPAAEFSPEKHTATGLRAWCRKCCSERAADWNKAHPERFRENQRRSALKRQYGITPERYDEMLTEQGSRCAICHRPPGPRCRLQIDHCHTKGTVRGLLCFKCNTFLGAINDDPAAVERLLVYLSRD